MRSAAAPAAPAPAARAARRAGSRRPAGRRRRTGRRRGAGPGCRPGRAPPGTGPTGQPSVCRTSRSTSSGVRSSPASAEHPRGLAARHREVAGADVDQLALRAQPADRQRGLLARREHELRAVGQELRERGERAERLGRAHALHVVEHQHERAVDPLEHPGHVRQRGAGIVAGNAPDVAEVLERTGELPEHELRVVVGVVGQDPAHRPAVRLEPVRQQRRLAVARRGHEQHERDVTGLGEPAHEPVALERARRGAAGRGATARPGAA